MFLTIEDGYFLDIGGKHPLMKSNTQPFIVNGWYGITVEASPKRSKYFFQQRYKQTTLNVAAGKPDNLTTFSEEQGKDNIPSKIIKVLEMSMKQMC